MEFTVDFSEGKPTGTYKTAEMEEAAQVDLKCSWVWSTEGDPDVMELCAAGLETVRKIIAMRDAMKLEE